ncbi:A/G-specific adenine glycosylase [Mucilaginibacter achroorhodeus]|uniref:Adenine DNA glycosylase n=1 Tax=Mucilaginibacter achroorhodeus TaxID=2599294 RepID=A0A563UAW8_9SPHI|nr:MULTISPECIES: A/G-specific adenine glycosylase [Mucilaginibacter]QXV66351.1 A/G-specific adenine glycosylase [Mucilaginibacter sp. 21P]TWR28527.1 A/G-specific adenine glycosylase [Mucilaginibacter achroorhodeus]
MDFSAQLIAWYQQHKRDLPWRNTTDAYIIWLSEIILQQTRVEQGMPYFYRFAERYPTVTDFAAASEDEVLRLWQGLGYYSRGRNMLKTAQLVQEEYDGKFPTTYNELIKLKGVGEYTAAAISSFSANEARAVVDGNVYRVLSRYFGVDEPINSPKGKKLFQQIADDVLDKQRPALHNQAMMEFGAMLCKPKNPACGICPVKLHCEAFKHNAINSLPVKLKTIKIKKRFFNYLLIFDDKTVLMNKRGDGDIWANMYDLPLVETNALLEPMDVLQLPEMTKFGKTNILKDNSGVIKHVLTHQQLFIRFLILDKFPEKLQDGWFYANIDDLEKLAMPKCVFIFIKNIFNF